MKDINDASAKKAFPSNLKRIMQQKNIKSKDLAARIGVSKSTVSNYRSGTSTPRIERLYKIAEVLQVSVDELICAPKPLEAPKTKNTTLREDATSTPQYKVPIFSTVLSNSDQIYRNDNFVDSIKLSFSVFGDHNCYAVKIYNNLLSASGFAHGSLVLFAADTEVKNGQFAAVLLKAEKKVVIRRVKFYKAKTTLFTDESSVSYSNKNVDAEIKILGRVITATFFPNS